MRLSFFSLLAIFLLTSCEESKKTLHVFVWSDFIKQEVIEAFEEKYDCKVSVDIFDSNEAMFAKLKTGLSAYDIIFPTSYFVPLLENQQLLEKLDLNKIPNHKFLDFKYLKGEENSSIDYSFPYMISYGVIGYRKDRVPEPLHSWDIFADEALAGRMTLLNDVREVIGAGLKKLGYSLNSQNEQEIHAAADLVLQWKKNIAKFESEQYKNGLASAEYLVAQGYTSDLAQVQEETEEVDFFYPVEGTSISCDRIAIPKIAPEKELAYAFLNYLFEPEVSAANMEYTYSLCPNLEAYALLDEEFQKSPALFPPPEILEKSEYIQDLGEKASLLYFHVWDRVRSE